MAYRKEDLITASEVARYVYCRRAWAYDRKGIRVQRRGLLRLFPSGRGLLVLLVIVFVLIIGLLIATQMIGSGS